MFVLCVCVCVVFVMRCAHKPSSCLASFRSHLASLPMLTLLVLAPSATGWMSVGGLGVSPPFAFPACAIRPRTVICARGPITEASLTQSWHRFRHRDTQHTQHTEMDTNREMIRRRQTPRETARTNERTNARTKKVQHSTAHCQTSSTESTA